MFSSRDDALQTAFPTPLDYSSEAFIPELQWEKAYFQDQSPNNSPISIQNPHHPQFQQDFGPEISFDRASRPFEYYSSSKRSSLENPKYRQENSSFPSHAEPYFEWVRDSDIKRSENNHYNRQEEYISPKESSKLRGLRRRSSKRRSNEIFFPSEGYLDTPDSLYNKNRSFFEEDASYMSNLSTQESECLKDWSQEFYKSSSGKKSEINDLEHHVLAEVLIEGADGCESLVIYNDANIETLLNNACVRNNIKGRLGLCFKINVLKMLNEMYPQEEKVGILLDKLLEVNYALVMSEIKNENIENKRKTKQRNYDNYDNQESESPWYKF